MKVFCFRKLLGLCFSVFLSIVPIAIYHEPFSSTGHDEFASLSFKRQDIRLLKDIPEIEANDLCKRSKWKFFGWSAYYLYEYEDCTYVSNTIFSRSNKTSMPYSFDYSLQEVALHESSVTIKGSVSVKESMKLKKLDLQSTQELDITGSSSNTFKSTESGALTITVNPNKRMTLRVTGNAKLSTCFARYYLFGIAIKKGAFECIDIYDQYYELIETDV